MWNYRQYEYRWQGTSYVENGISRFLWKWNVVEPLVVAIKMLLSRCSPRLISGFSIDTIYTIEELRWINFDRDSYWLLKNRCNTFKFYICLIDRITSTLCLVGKFFLHLPLNYPYQKWELFFFLFFFFPRNLSLYSLYFDRTWVIDQCLSRKLLKKDLRSCKIRSKLSTRGKRVAKTNTRGWNNASNNAGRYELTARLILPGRLSSVSINSRFTILPVAGLITIRIIARQ